jgi:hypothetical protein
MFRKRRALAHLGILILSTIFAVAQHSSTVAADQTWNELAAGNHRFVLGKTAPHDFLAQRKALTKSQHPRVAVLSCSDSRVPPGILELEYGWDSLWPDESIHQTSIGGLLKLGRFVTSSCVGVQLHSFLRLTQKAHPELAGESLPWMATKAFEQSS